MDTRVFGWVAILAGAGLFLVGAGLIIFGISSIQISHLSQLPASSINQTTVEANWLTNAGIWIVIPGALVMLLGYVFGFVVYEQPLAPQIQPPTPTPPSFTNRPASSGSAPKTQVAVNEPPRGRAVQPGKNKQNTPPTKKKPNTPQPRKHNFSVRAAFLGVIMLFFGILARFKPDIFAKASERLHRAESTYRLHETTSHRY